MASLKAHHPDAPPLILHWPLLYANKELVGQGTLLTVSGEGVTGGGYNAGQDGHGPKGVDLARTPRQALYVGEARVLWAGANEFGLELRHMDVEDQQWLLSFFIECGHSFRWLDVRNPQLQGIANGQCFRS
jgi:hypothetical protein